MIYINYLLELPYEFERKNVEIKNDECEIDMDIQDIIKEE
jgi:hypothetical protein